MDGRLPRGISAREDATLIYVYSNGVYELWHSCLTVRWEHHDASGEGLPLKRQPR